MAVSSANGKIITSLDVRTWHRNIGLTDCIVTHISRTPFGKHRPLQVYLQETTPPSNMDSKNPGSNGSNASNSDGEGYTLVQSKKQQRSQKKAERSPRTAPKASSDDMFGDSDNGGSKTPPFFRTIADIHCHQQYPPLPPSPTQPGVPGPSGTRSVRSSPRTKRHVISIF